MDRQGKSTKLSMVVNGKCESISTGQPSSGYRIRRGGVERLEGGEKERGREEREKRGERSQCPGLNLRTHIFLARGTAHVSTSKSQRPCSSRRETGAVVGLAGYIAPAES